MNKFKIQYGEIYSGIINALPKLATAFKIQYGEIYRYITAVRCYNK